MKALLVAALLAQAPPDAVVATKALVVTPTGEHYDFSGGCYLPEGRCIATAKELASLRVQAVELKQRPSPVPLVIAGIGFGVLLGVVGGYFLLPPRSP